MTQYTAWNEPNHQLSNGSGAHPDSDPTTAGATALDTYTATYRSVLHRAPTERTSGSPKSAPTTARPEAPSRRTTDYALAASGGGGFRCPNGGGGIKRPDEDGPALIGTSFGPDQTFTMVDADTSTGWALHDVETGANWAYYQDVGDTLGY